MDNSYYKKVLENTSDWFINQHSYPSYPWSNPDNYAKTSMKVNKKTEYNLSFWTIFSLHSSKWNSSCLIMEHYSPWYYKLVLLIQSFESYCKGNQKKLPLVTIIKNTTKLGSLTIQILQRCSVHTERLTRRHIDNVVYYSFGLPSVSLLDNKIFTKHQSI